MHNKLNANQKCMFGCTNESHFSTLTLFTLFFNYINGLKCYAQYIYERYTSSEQLESK